jgi:hypothetical protein
MNTNESPALVPLWHRGQNYEITVPRGDPDRAEDPDPASAQLSTIAEPSPNRGLPAISTPRPKRTYDRHKRKCAICHHREREAIDEAFLQWLHPHQIVNDFNLPGRSALYRHADATGLLALRRRRMHRVLDRIIERVDSAPITGNNVLRAIILNTRFTDDGVYVEPPKRTEIAYINERGEPISNRDTLRLETSATATK